MGGSRSQNPRYRYAIGLRFEIPMAFEKDGDEMFEQVYRLATKQITEKLSYNNDEITENQSPSKEFMDESVNQILKRFFNIEELFGHTLWHQSGQIFEHVQDSSPHVGNARGKHPVQFFKFTFCRTIAI